MFYLFLFCSLMVFSQTYDWIFTKPTTVENCTHCSISHAEEIKYTADNSLSISRIKFRRKNQKKSREEKLQIKCGLVRGKFSPNNFTS